MKEFTHLHLHTGYSLADSTLKPDKLAKRIKELGMKSVAITDHGVMFGAVTFYKECKKQGIKAIIGMEAYVSPRVNTMKEGKLDDANYHLVLLCKNNEGYNNLMKIASDASINGFYYKPRTDKNKLRKYSSGLIALSACLGGEVNSYLLDDDYARAKETAVLYNNIFGEGNFYLELQDHGIQEQRQVNRLLLEISRETGIPVVCTNDSHYLYQEDNKPHDVLMAIQAKTTVTDTKRKMYTSDQFYVKSPSEMCDIFGHIDGAIENTQKIADMCNVDFEFGVSKIPAYINNKGIPNKEYLRELVISGAIERYGKISEEIMDRINYEIDVVSRMNYVDYFLITWDFVKYARDNKILVGPGRGSGAGSIMLYCLYITAIDPLRYDLLFERGLKCAR